MRSEPPALLSAGFRLFFPAAAAWAVISMLLWVLMLHGVIALPTAFHPVTWHLHELLFGFVAAAVAGFLLTAVPTWTGRPPLAGLPLALLGLLWLAGRLAVAASAWTGAPAALAADTGFLAALALVVGREVIAGGSHRNLPVLGILVLLIVANVLIHLGLSLGAAWTGAGERLAIGVIVVLISIIGGRIVPAFTRNWLRVRGSPRLPPAGGRFDTLSVLTGAVALGTWVVAGLGPATGGVLVLAGLLHGVRLARWQGLQTGREPLLWILHAGQAWLALGLVFLGTAAWKPHLTSAAIHALTAGAMGTMIIAVMTRATLGHSGQPLRAGGATLAVYLLILGAAISRIASPLIGGAARGPLLDLAAALWMAGFAGFLALYLPLCLRRRTRPERGPDGPP